MSDTAAELRLLSMADEKHRFAIEMNYQFNEALQAAFERGIDEQWFTLVDVSQMADGHIGPGYFRVFRLTDAGLNKLKLLRLRQEANAKAEGAALDAWEAKCT